MGNQEKCVETEEKNVVQTTKPLNDSPRGRRYNSRRHVTKINAEKPKGVASTSQRNVTPKGKSFSTSHSKISSKMSGEGPSNVKRTREEDVDFRVISKEDKEFTLSKKAAQLCGTVNHYAENTGLTDDAAISTMEPMTLPTVSSESLHHIVRWCEQHRNCPAWEEEKWWQNERDAELTKWEDEFMAEMTSETLYNVFLAANFMDIKCLLDKCAQTVADMIKGKSVEEIREIWMLENDFTPEEEEEIKNENPWEAILRYQEQLEKDKEEAAQQESSSAQA